MRAANRKSQSFGLPMSKGRQVTQILPLLWECSRCHLDAGQEGGGFGKAQSNTILDNNLSTVVPPILLKYDHSSLRVLGAVVYSSLDGCCVVGVPVAHCSTVLGCIMSFSSCETTCIVQALTSAECACAHQQARTLMRAYSTQGATCTYLDRAENSPSELLGALMQLRSASTPPDMRPPPEATEAPIPHRYDDVKIHKLHRLPIRLSVCFSRDGFASSRPSFDNIALRLYASLPPAAGFKIITKAVNRLSLAYSA